METILSRIAQFAKNKNITIGALERSIGASKGVLSRAIANGTDIQAKWITSIVENYPEISTTWLLTGRGSMLQEQQEETSSTVSEYTKEDDIMAFRAKEGSKQRPIPLVTQSAAAGFGSMDFSISENDVKDYYIVPKFRYCRVDFMIELSGSSMYPNYNSGDVVACTILHDRNFIQWNKCHIIATREQGLLCKRICKSEKEGYIKAVSDNKEYPPFDIPVDEIAGIALVCGVIRLE